MYPQGIGPEFTPTWTGTGAVIVCLCGWWLSLPLLLVIPAVLIPSVLLMWLQHRQDARLQREYLEWVRTTCLQKPINRKDPQ